MEPIWLPHGEVYAVCLCKQHGVNKRSLPVFCLRRSIPLSAIFEPVAHLRGGEPRALGQLPFLPG